MEGFQKEIREEPVEAPSELFKGGSLVEKTTKKP